MDDITQTPTVDYLLVCLHDILTSWVSFNSGIFRFLIDLGPGFQMIKGSGSVSGNECFKGSSQLRHTFETSDALSHDALEYHIHEGVYGSQFPPASLCRAPWKRKLLVGATKTNERNNMLDHMLDQKRDLVLHISHSVREQWLKLLNIVPFTLHTHTPTHAHTQSIWHIKTTHSVWKYSKH